jgi:hypothetical protein
VIWIRQEFYPLAVQNGARRKSCSVRALHPCYRDGTCSTAALHTGRRTYRSSLFSPLTNVLQRAPVCVSSAISILLLTGRYRAAQGTSDFVSHPLRIMSAANDRANHLMAGNTTPFPLIGAIRCYLALTWLGGKMLIGMTTQYGNDLEHGPARWSARGNVVPQTSEGDFLTKHSASPFPNFRHCPRCAIIRLFPVNLRCLLWRMGLLILNRNCGLRRTHCAITRKHLLKMSLVRVWAESHPKTLI